MDTKVSMLYPHAPSADGSTVNTYNYCSQYQLSISENRGSLEIYAGWDAADYGQLLQIPVRASNDYYTIADIEDNGQALHGQFVNLLAAVRSVSTPS